jgi:hypothetical protein
MYSKGVERLRKVNDWKSKVNDWKYGLRKVEVVRYHDPQ